MTRAKTTSQAGKPLPRRLRSGWAAITIAIGCQACAAAQKAPAHPPPSRPAVSSDNEMSPPESSRNKRSAAAHQLAFSASAQASTEALAYEQASRRLLVALANDEAFLEPEPFSDALTRAVHSKTEHFFESSSTKTGIEVQLGLRDSDLAPVFSTLAEATESVRLQEGPDVLADALRRARVARIIQLLCKRSQELVADVECEVADADGAMAELTALLMSVRLVPWYRGGIPHDGERFLRPLRVKAILPQGGRDIELASLPVLVEGVLEEPQTVTTDADGVVSVTLGDEDQPQDEFVVRVDTEQLLGPLASQAPSPSVKVAGRKVGLSRAAVVPYRSGRATDSVLPDLNKALAQRVRRPVKLDHQELEMVRRLPQAALRSALPQLAERMRGALDLVVFVEADSEFASRMGTHRVWYEARGKLVVINAWTGELEGEFEAVVTESGVGESRAERASREALAAELSQKLLDEMADW